MSSNPLIRWGGLAYVFGALGLILQQGYALAAPDPTAPAWTLVHTIGYIGLAFGLLGFVAVFARQINHFKRLGQTGFVLGFLGNAMTVGAAFMNTFIVPVLMREAPALMGTGPTDPGPLFGGPLGGVILLAALLVTVGFILFGIATLQAGILPRGAAILIMLGAWFGLAAAFSTVAFAVGGIIFGVGNAWLGWAVWSTKAQPA